MVGAVVLLSQVRPKMLLGDDVQLSPFRAELHGLLELAALAAGYPIGAAERAHYDVSGCVTWSSISG